jgi:hypothetical protein
MILHYLGIRGCEKKYSDLEQSIYFTGKPASFSEKDLKDFNSKVNTARIYRHKRIDTKGDSMLIDSEMKYSQFLEEIDKNTNFVLQ